MGYDSINYHNCNGKTHMIGKHPRKCKIISALLCLGINSNDVKVKMLNDEMIFHKLMTPES